MKHRLYLALSAIFIGWALVSCTEEFALNLSSTDDITLDESDIVDVSLAVSINNFSVYSEGATRTEEPSDEVEIMTDFEKKVDNMWVFQYDTSGNLLIRPRYYTAAASETDGTWSVVLKPFVESKIYVVTNVAEGESWATEYNNFSTIDKLQASTLPAPYSIYNLSDESIEGHIPAQGYAEETVTSGETVIVPVEHLYAKVKVRVILDRSIEQYNPSVNYVVFQNSPFYCRISSLYDGDDATSKDSNYGTETDDWGEYSLTTDGEGNNINDPNNEPLIEAGEGTYDYVIYVPENIQGEQGDESSTADTKETEGEKIKHASKVVVDLLYYNSANVESSKLYTVYPGGNSVDNFNIRRNQVYRVTMRLGYPIEPDPEPSANCIVGHPNSIISFEPYYRLDEGGTYSFTDYLDPDDETKQIKGIKILWQTENCIGDNSKGDLVYFLPSDPQDLHDKIYVTTNQPGNAVIAAYNDEDCEGDIIWSWHIWVTSEDPTNIGNAITYYTYRWDENGIYGYESGEARIPGYGCMPCNLGALASTPEDAHDQKVFGMNYQWGRKDPFPPLNIGEKNHGSGSSCNDYTVENVQQLYDNSHEATIEMTATEGTGTEMFRSISGNTIVASPETYGVRYTIAHPTQFMCGAYYAGDLDFESTVDGKYGYGSSAAYHNAGDWLPAGYSDNRLWGALEITDDMKKFTINSSSGIHLYDDYGEKTIFDPCPYGWRVSPPDQWLGFTKTGYTTGDYTDINTVTSTSNTNTGYGMLLYIQTWKSGLTSFFPTPGPRIGNGCGFRQYSCGNYHNATADDNNRVNILHIHDTSTNFCLFETNYGYTRKSVAGPIRCVRDSK